MSTTKAAPRKKAIARRRAPVKPRAKTAPAKTAAKKSALKADAPKKLAHLEAALRARGGATISDLMEATGWQAHSVRGALAGALKARGLVIVSEKIDGERRYRIEARG